MTLDALQTEQLAFLQRISSESPEQLDGPDGIKHRALKSLYKQEFIHGIDASEGLEFSVLEPTITQTGYSYKEELERRSA